jgi:hypothetical protein
VKHLALIALSGLVAAPLFSDPRPLPADGVHYATYDFASGKIVPNGGGSRMGDMVWGTPACSGWFVDGQVQDWGDIAPGQAIDGFLFGYATELLLPDRLDVIIWFYGEENGCNSHNQVPLAGFNITDLPTGGPTWNSWLVTIDLTGSGHEFRIDGSDLDGDGLTDFGYGFWFQGVPPETATGPLIAEPDPNADPNDPNYDPFPTAPGAEDGWWHDGNCVMSPYGGDPFAQICLELYGPEPNWPCPNPGPHGKYCLADIDCSGDCLVGLADLAQLLSNYGLTSGATRSDGDVQPFPWGDGDVDLADLAELLTQYGDDCN